MAAQPPKVRPAPSFIVIDTPRPARPNDFHWSEVGHSVEDAEYLERAKRRARFPRNRKGTRAFLAAEARRR